MKRILPCLLLLACAASARAADAAPAPAPGPAPEAADGRDAVFWGFEIKLGGVFFDADDWKDSSAAFGDLGLTVWEPNRYLGLWAGFGGQGAELLWDDPWGEVESDVTAVPVGASLLLRCPLGDSFAVRAEAGARYVATDVEDWRDHYDHRRHRKGDKRDLYWNPERYLDVDDTSFAVAALQLEFSSGNGYLSVGGGYQFDLEKPDVEYCGRRIGRLDFSGAYFHVGGGFVF